MENLRNVVTRLPACYAGTVPSFLRISTPLGIDLLVGSDGERIVSSDFRHERGSNGSSKPDALLREARDQVRAYFRKRLRRFELPLAFDGTPFQVRVWECVSALEVGEVVSYVDVARAVGHPRAHRGVAMAMGKAPFDLFVPAHRVVGADGRIKGATPTSLRRRLLTFEGIAIRG